MSERKEIKNIIAIDLEMAQPSNAIIEIGATIGSLYDRTILDSKSFFVNPHEPLSDFIKTLCHVSQETVDAAPDLAEAYQQMVDWAKPYDPHRMCVTWGAGDCRTLRSQLDQTGLKYEWIFGRTEMNVKNLVQAQLLASGHRIQGGLAKSLTKFGLAFKGTCHIAKDDSLNTLLMYYRYLDLIKENQFGKIKER